MQGGRVGEIEPSSADHGVDPHGVTRCETRNERLRRYTHRCVTIDDRRDGGRTGRTSSAVFHGAGQPPSPERELQT